MKLILCGSINQWNERHYESSYPCFLPKNIFHTRLPIQAWSTYNHQSFNSDNTPPKIHHSNAITYVMIATTSKLYIQIMVAKRHRRLVTKNIKTDQSCSTTAASSSYRIVPKVYSYSYKMLSLKPLSLGKVMSDLPGSPITNTLEILVANLWSRIM